MFKQERVIFVENEINDTVEILKTVITDFKSRHFLVDYKRSYPVVIPYEEGLNRHLLIKLDNKSGYLNFLNIFNSSKEKNISRNSAPTSIPFFLLHCAETFITLTRLEDSVKITFSTYFVPSYELKFIGKILSASLGIILVAFLIATIFPSTTFIFALAGFSFISLFFNFLLSFPFGLFYYFSYRNLFNMIFDEILKNLTMIG